jgi:glycine cleavage system transcriptional repressor
MGVYSMQQSKITNKTKNLSKIDKENKTTVAKPIGVSYLNLISLGENSNNSNIAQILTSLIATYNCNIINSRMIELGQDLAFSAFISGKWNNIFKLEKSLMVLNKKYPLHVYTKRNNILENIDLLSETNLLKPSIKYIVQTTTIDKPGLLNKLLQFFYRENITIKEVNTNSHPYNINIANIEIQIKIPTDLHIVSLRERFLTYCDTLNLDISLEPMN